MELSTLALEGTQPPINRNFIQHPVVSSPLVLLLPPPLVFFLLLFFPIPSFEPSHAASFASSGPNTISKKPNASKPHLRPKDPRTPTNSKEKTEKIEKISSLCPEKSHKKKEQETPSSSKGNEKKKELEKDRDGTEMETLEKQGPRGETRGAKGGRDGEVASGTLIEGSEKGK